MSDESSGAGPPSLLAAPAPADPPLNQYNDRLLQSTASFGAEIAVQRLDRLDAAAIRDALDLEPHDGLAVDVGGGLGMQALRFASLGLRTLLIDRLPEEATLAGSAALSRVLPLAYLQRDARSLRREDFPEPILLAYSQRFIHYLHWAESVTLLGVLRARMRAGARLFLSASGLGSELGDGYAHRERPPEQRFAPLAPEVAARHGIHAPVCLYDEADLVRLAEAAGLRTFEVFSSAFGNVKGIFGAP